MEVKPEAGAAGILEPEIKMEEEEEEKEEDSIDPKIGETKGAAPSRTAGTLQVKKEQEDEMSGNWDARLQDFLKTLRAPPSPGKTSQQLEKDSVGGSKRSPVPSKGTRGPDREPKGWGVSPGQLHLPGDAGQEPSGHLDATSLAKERERALPTNPAKAEMQRQRFRTLRYKDASGPREICQELRERCREWLEPEKHSKEQILELVTLEQFLAVLPVEVQGWIKGRGPGSCAEAVTLVEEFLRRQPETKIRDVQATGLSEEHGASSPMAREVLHSQEKPQLSARREDGCKGNGSVPAEDRYLREKKERRPLAGLAEQRERPIGCMKTGHRGSVLSLGEAEESQHKAEGSKGEARAIGLDRPDQPQGACEEITRAATQEEEEEEEENGVKEDPGKEDPLLVAPEDPEREKPFQCWHCRRSFSSSVKLVTHERTHVGEKFYTCSSCGESERTHTGQKPHKCSQCGNTFGWSPQERLHGGEKPYSCSECGKSCSQRSDLLKHQRTHTGEKPYQCSACGKKFRNGSGLKVHQRIHTGEKPYQCSHCGKSFSWSSDFISHERIHTAFCSFCGRSFGQKAELVAHEETHVAGEALACFTCSKTFDLSSKLVAHVRTHKEKPFACPICGKTFRNSLQRLAHQKAHTGEKQHQCAHCGKSFSQRQTLRVHERIHTGEKPHQCLVCGKNFTNISNLKSHERTHTGEKPYKCSHCEKSFKWSSNLVLHERTHTREKPFRCSDCGRTFDRRPNLLVHMRIHTGQRPYICSACGKSFASNSVLLRHHKIHIGDEICPCSQCGKSFHQQPGRAEPVSKCSECLSGRSQNSDILAHTRRPTEEKQFECPVCGKTFRNSSHLLTHQSVHMGVQPSRCMDCGRSIVRRPNLIPTANDPAGPKPHKCLGCQKRSNSVSVS